MEEPISPKNENGLDSDIGMLSPKEGEVNEPPLDMELPLALSGRTGEEG